ncbi:MAG: hypothetical protein P8Z40_09855, partial [Chloroflexota bacterium]
MHILSALRTRTSLNGSVSTRIRMTKVCAVLVEAALAETAAAGGFTINLNILPSAQYWDIWTEVDLGITIWAHRP